MMLKQIAHLVRKDLQHARWLIVAWVAVVALDFAYRANVTRLVTRVAPVGSSTSQDVWITGITCVCTLLVVSWFVHADPLPGTQAFWLTRPLDRDALYASKVAGLLLVLIVPGLIALAIFQMAWGVRPFDIAHALAESAVVSVAMLTLLFAAAAVARHLSEMLTFLAGAATLLSLVSLASAPSTLLEWLASERPTPTNPFSGDLERYVGLTFVLLLAAIGTATWWIYRTRRRASGLALLLTLVLIIGLAPRTLRATRTADDFVGLPRITEAWATPERLPARVLFEERQPTVKDMRDPTHVYSQRPDFPVHITAPIVLEALPPGYTATPWLFDIEWRVGDLVHREAAAWMGAFPALQPQRNGTYRPSLAYIDSRTEATQSAPGGREAWSALLTIPQPVYARYRHTPGHYAATVRYIVRRHEPLATLPVRAGTSWTDGSQRIEILATEDDRHCKVDLRRVTMEFYWGQSRQPTLGLRFEDGQGNMLPPRAGDGGPLPYPPALGFTPTMSGQALRVRYDTHWLLPLAEIPMIISIGSGTPRKADAAPDRFQPQPPQSQSPPPPAPALACADARWTAVRSTFVGVIERRIAIPDFVLEP